MSPETDSVSPTTENTVTTRGRVKWFNNRAGYGFITVSGGEHKGDDVFVHHSAVQVDKEQYRYLVQGEYVDFKLCHVENDNHKSQAGEVSGVEGGQLMCETRLETRSTRTPKPPDTSFESNHTQSHHTQSHHTQSHHTPSHHTQSNNSEQAPHYRIRSRGPGPRESDEWMLVRRRPQTNRSRGTTTDPSPPQEVVRSRTKTDNM